MSHDEDRLTGPGELNRLVEEFSTAWRSGRRPKIEEFLSQIAPSQAASLLRALLAIEIQQRRENGEQPALEGYLVRFCDHAALVDEIFRQADEPPPRDASAEGTHTIDVDATPDFDPDATLDHSRPDDPAAPAIGRFGDYELLEYIAEGGMGVVYKARQVSLNRIVAVKMILAGRLARQDQVQRFYTEARSAAQLQHPGIVAIHEVGHHAGRHFFSMDFIEGRSLSDVVRERPLPAREAARLVREIAAAIQYAHEHGTLHRDLKPSNVLIDAQGNVRVTDFGLAKQTAAPREETDRAEDFPASEEGEEGQGLTLSGQILGTPSYMPPEQARGDLAAVGPHSDVYSLGALLYRLMCGRPPFQAARVAETLRQVLEQEPASPRQINPEVARDLETICLKCLQKDPRKRYESAAALADDLGRFLAEEPIHARPVGIGERAWKWARRRPAAASLIFVVAAALAVVMGVVLVYNSQLREGNRLLSDANTETRRQRDNARLAQRHAESNASVALNTLGKVVYEFQEKLSRTPAARQVQRELLNSAVTEIQALALSLSKAPTASHSLAAAHLQLGDLYLLMGAKDATDLAMEQFGRAEKITQSLLAADNDNPEYLRTLSFCFVKAGQLHVRLGDLGRAADLFGQSLRIRKELAELQPDNQQWQRDVAAVSDLLGDVTAKTVNITAAHPFYDAALRIREMLHDQSPQDEDIQVALSASCEKIGNAVNQMGQAGKALAFYRRALELSEKLAMDHRDDILHSRNLAVLCERVGDIYFQQTNPDKASDYYLKSLSIRRRLDMSDRNNALLQRDLSIACNKLGDVFLHKRQFEMAQKSYREGLNLRMKLALADSQDVQAQRDLSVSYDLLGAVALEQQDLPTALDQFQKSRDIRRKLCGRDEDNQAARGDLAIALVKLGQVNHRARKLAAARALFREAAGMQREFAAASGASVRNRRNFAGTLEHQGDVEMDAGEFVQARDFYYGSFLEREKISREDAHALPETANSRYKLGMAEMQAFQYPRAVKWFTAALADFRQIGRQAASAQQREAAAELAKETQRLLTFCQQAARAIEDIDFALAQPKQDAMLLLTIRLNALAGRNDHANLSATAEKLVALDPKHGMNLHSAAAGYASIINAVGGGKPTSQLTAGEKALRQRYAGRAVELLRQAFDLGYFKKAETVELLKKDSAFDVLKDRAEFRNLMEALEGEKKQQD